MANFIINNKLMSSKYAQAFLVLIAFFFMVLTTYYFVRNTELKHLRKNAQDTIRFTEANITSDMLEPETLLGGISETIRSMLLNGANSEAINNFFIFTNSYVNTSGGRRLLGVTGFYGYFEIFDGLMLIGGEEWDIPGNYESRTRPWYIGAVNAAGDSYITEPYLNVFSNEITITVSRCLFDDYGNILGIICVNIEMNRISHHAVNARFAENGYGFLLSSELVVIAHPDNEYIGRQFTEIRSDIAQMINEIVEHGLATEFVTKDFRGIKSIVFAQKLSNGWFMAVVTPSNYYFSGIRDLLITLIILGTIFAFSLIWLLLRINEEKKKADERTQMITGQQRRLLDAVNTAAAILLANNDMNNFETSLLKCFDILGHCLDVDRVQIWRNEIIEDEPHFILRHEWLSDHGKTCKILPAGLHFPYTMKKEWAKKFLKREYINAPVRELSEEDQGFLGYYEMKSIVIIPMFLDNDFWGLFSIDDCRTERTFSEEEISILTSAGLMMSSAINRNIQTKKMRQTEERTQIMLDAAPLSIVFWDKDLSLIDCNKEALYMFKAPTKEEFIQKFKTFSPEYQEDGELSWIKGHRLVKKALDEGYSRFEWTHQTMEGELIPADIICIRVRHKDEYMVTEYIRDLREQKAMIAEMRKAEIAEESSKAKSDFLAKMSHEIRTPMNAILGITEIQLQDDSHPQVIREAFERINNSGDLLLGIINDILDLSKIEAGKLVLIQSQYDIASLIHDVVQLNIMRYENKPIEFGLDVREDLPQMLIGDEIRIKQILNNLLSNAFKYTVEGKVNLSVYSERTGTNDSSKIQLVFIVSDTGQGMTAEQVSKLGTEYSRFNMEANRKTEGTGLGMNITRNLISLMNGEISIESTPGVGSRFMVRLPQGCLGSTVIGKELADNLMQLNLDENYKIRPTQMKRDFMPYGRILVVDDVETNLYVAKGLMAPYGLSIDTAMSGFEAIDKIRDGCVYDVIFMDHMMPRMDGIEATKIIRSLGYTNPVVALTANALAGQAEMFLDSGFNDFISKPIDIRQLNVTLNKLIRDKQDPAVIEAARKQKETLYFKNGKKRTVDPQLAEYFVRDAKKAVKVLELIYVNKFRRADDISIFIINIHAMKSALANIGEKELSAEAERLEKAGREQNLKLILTDIPLFLDRLCSVIEKHEAKEEAKEEAKDLADADDISNLKDKLNIIKEACILFDKKTARNILKEIKQKEWPQDINDRLSIISEKLLHSEFEETARIINEYLNS